MSDMEKWLNILNENHRPGGSVVRISQDQGGGVGKFVKYSGDGNSALVDLKGEMREFAVEDLEDPIEEYYDEEREKSTQNYGEQSAGEHYLGDKPEMQPGDSVEIADIYGVGNGKGYGVFVANSHDGTSVIVNFDGRDRSVPVDAVSKSPEENCQDNFASTGNDGSMSPMTKAGDNVSDIQMENSMSDLEKWRELIESAEEDEVEEVEEAEDCDTEDEDSEEKIDEGVCGCYSHTCLTCFPASIIKENSILDTVMDILEMDDDEMDDDLDESYDDVTAAKMYYKLFPDDHPEEYLDDMDDGNDSYRMRQGRPRIGSKHYKPEMDENTELNAIPDAGQAGPMDPEMGQGMLPVEPQAGMDVPDGEPDVMVMTPDGAGLEEPCCDGDPRLEPEMAGGPDAEVMDLLARLQDILGAGAGGGMAEVPGMGAEPEMSPGIPQDGEEVVLQMSEMDAWDGRSPYDDPRYDDDDDDDDEDGIGSDAHGDWQHDQARDARMESAEDDDEDKEEVDESGKSWEDDEDAIEEGVVDPEIAEWMARFNRG